MVEDSATKAAIEQLSERAGINKINPFKKLHYSTTHLPFFHEFSSLTNLYGKHYIPILKARWYQLVGGIIQKKVSLGSLKIDTRLSVAYPIVTEGGKNEIIYSIKNLINRGIEKNSGKKFTMSEPASFHPEQLIGKYIEVEEEYTNENTGRIKKRKVRIENRGHLNNDFLDFDECNLLINAKTPDMQQARELLSKAENTIGKNEVEKRLVEDLKEHTVKYFPECTNSYYFQPHKKLQEDIFLQGFLRRKLIPIGNVKLFLNQATEEIYSNKLHSTNYSEEDYENRLIEFVETTRQISEKVDYVFTDEATELISTYALYLSAQGQLHSDKISNYSKIIKYTILSYLVKMSAIITSAHYLQVIDKDAVSLAFMDLVELMQNTFDFIYERTWGDFSYGTDWGGADYKQKECLKFLFDEKAYSFSTSKITIEEFVGVCEKVFDVKQSQGRNRYLDMKKINLIDSKQDGKHDSKVWLKITPEDHKNYLKGNKGYEGYDTYNMVFHTLNDILTRLKASQPLKPLTAKMEEK